MIFIFDTNVVSLLRRPDRADPKAIGWLQSVDDRSATISVITLTELQHGILMMLRRDKAQGLPMRAWFEDMVMPRFGGPALPIDAEVAIACAALHVPNRRPDRDAYIAATALVHNLTVVTRNTRDFEGTGVRIINPWLDT